MEMNDEHNRVRRFRDLLVWKNGILPTNTVYSMTQRSPAEEKFGRVSQMRRAAVSVPLKARARGEGRETRGEPMNTSLDTEMAIAELAPRPPYH